MFYSLESFSRYLFDYIFIYSPRIDSKNSGNSPKFLYFIIIDIFNSTILFAWLVREILYSLCQNHHWTTSGRIWDRWLTLALCNFHVIFLRTPETDPKNLNIFKKQLLHSNKFKNNPMKKHSFIFGITIK